MPTRERIAWTVLVLAVVLHYRPLSIVPAVVGDRELAVVVVHETADTTAEMARLVTELRTGAAEEYCKSKNHELLVLDVDTVDEDGKRHRLLTDDVLVDLSLPALVLLDRDSQAIVHREKLPASVEQIIEIVRQHGG